MRADVQALGVGIDARGDALVYLQALDLNLARLPNGDIRRLLRDASAKLRRAVEQAER